MRIRALSLVCLVALVSSLLIAPAAAEGSSGLSGPCGDLVGTEEGLSEGPTDYGFSPRPQGAVDMTFLFVDFPDAPAGSDSTADYLARLMPRAEDWYATASYGQVAFDTVAIDEWFRMPQDSTDYDFRRGLTYEQHHAYMQDAVAAADAEVDFSGVDVLVVVPTKVADIPLSPTFRASAGFGLVNDENEILYGVTMGAEMWNEGLGPEFAAHTLAHELGHVFGLPDLYVESADLDVVWEPTGSWDNMSYTTYATDFLAWHKWKLGWLSENDITCLGAPGVAEEGITPVEIEGGTKALVVRTGAATAWVAEVRRATGNDADICEEGVLVYSVDASATQRPVVVASNEADDPGLENECGPKYKATLVPGESFEDPESGVTFDVLSEGTAGFLVRATNPGPYSAPAYVYARSLSLRFSEHLLAQGDLTSTFDPCGSEMLVKIQKKRYTSWKTVAVTDTDASGAFSVAINDRPGRYRAKAAPAEADPLHVCAATKSAAARHQH